MLLILASLLAPLFFPPAASADPRPVLVIVGLAKEAELVTSTGTLVVVSAGNASLLRARLQSIHHEQIRAVVSFGIAGALDPALEPGDLFVGGRVNGDTKTWDSDPALTAFVTAQSLPAKTTGKTGLVLGRDGFFATDAASRAAVRSSTGGDLIDEESHIAAAFAESEGLPFTVIRSIADPASLTLEPAAMLPLTPSGEPDSYAIFYSVLKNPLQVPGLITLANCTTKALDALKAVISQIDWSQAPGAEARTLSSTSRPPCFPASPSCRTARK